MSIQSPGEFIVEKGWKGWLYHLIFPLDFLLSPTDDEGESYREEKYSELLPFFGWLVPLAILLSNTVSVGFVGMVLLFGFCSLLFAILSSLHLNLSAGKTIELGLNLWAGFAFTAVSIWLAIFFLGLFTSCDLDD